MFRDWQIKSETLIKLSECAKSLKMYDSSILLLKKALQFVWLTKDDDKELEIYDSLGLNYFYLGDMENAFYYHEKCMKGEIEGEFTAAKLLSNKNIDLFDNQLYIKQDKFTKLVMLNIFLPIKNIFESNESSPVTTKSPLKDKQKITNQTENSISSKNNISMKTFSDLNNTLSNQDQYDLMKCQTEFLVVPLCDFNKVVTFKNCNGKKIIENLVSTEEYQYTVSQPKEHKLQQEQIDSQQEEKFQKEDQGYSLTKTIKSQKKFQTKEKFTGLLAKQIQAQKQEDIKQMIHKIRLQNINLEEKVKDMINDKTSLQQIMNRIEIKVKNQKCMQFSQQKVNLNHLQDETAINNNKKNQTDPFFLRKKYLQLLSEVIGDYIFKKHF